MRVKALNGRTAVLVGGCRTPFLRSGAAFADVMAYELAAAAIAGLLRRTGIDPAAVDRLVMGTVLQEPRTSNLAREAGLVAGLPDACPAMTVTAACDSANVAIASAVEAVVSGGADVVVAGGAESLSDVPIRVSRAVRKRLLASRKAKGLAAWARLARGLKLRDLVPEVPAIAEFSTGLTMGDNAERLAKRLSLSRTDQDAFAARSHRLAAKATAEGLLAEEIVPAYPPPRFQPVETDDGIRADGTEEKLAALAPVFDRALGTVTAGNSSFLTDGAAVCLVVEEKRARELGLAPLARVASFAFVGLDPVEELLLGPAVAIPQALDAAGIGLEDAGVLEIHEAFAAPVLAVEKLLADDGFCRERLGRSGAVGRVDRERVNAWGGSLSLGHPFGATGARLVTTCARRLRHEKKRWGVAAACAAGGLGHAIVLEAM